MTTARPSNQQRKVVILSGPSGVGKAALKKRVIELGASNPNLPTYSMLPLLYSREPRKGEIDGGESLFVTKDAIARYDSSEVFRRKLYTKYWQAVRLKDLETAFTGDSIQILELPRLLAFDVMNRYVKIASVLLSPITIPKSWKRAHEREAEQQLKSRLRARAKANGDFLTNSELRLRIEEGIKLLHAAHEYEQVLVMAMASSAIDRDDIVEKLARAFIDFTTVSCSR